MGTSDFDAVRSDSMSDLDPVGVTFPEKVGDDVLRGHEVDVVPHEIGELSNELATLAPVGDSIDPPLWPACIERVQADLELFDLLVEHGAQGVVWETVVEELSAHASQVLEPWICSGKIYAQTTNKMLGVPGWAAGRDRLARDSTYREDVIAHIVVRALEKLQKGLRAGTGWNPGKGLSLASYFITGCVHEFVYVFKKEYQWWSTHQSELTESSEEIRDSPGLWSHRLGADPADIVTDRMAILEHLAGLPPDDRMALWAHAHGYSNAEIAYLMRVTTKAVERRLYRLRQKTHQSVRNLG